MIEVPEVVRYVIGRIPKATTLVEKLQTMDMTMLHLRGPRLDSKLQLTEELLKASDGEAMRWHVEVMVKEMQEEAIVAYGIDKLIEEKLERARIDGLHDAMQCIVDMRARLSAVILHKDVVAINAMSDLLNEIGAKTLRPASPTPSSPEVR